MSIIKKALANCGNNNSEAERFCEFIANFIETYGPILKEDNVLSFNIEISLQAIYHTDVIVWALDDLRTHTTTSFKPNVLVKLLRNEGAEVTELEDRPSCYYCHYYSVKFKVD